MNKLISQPNISSLLDENYKQHQTTLIHHDLDHLPPHDSLINQILTANPLSIATHNTRKLSDTTKYAQLLETLSLHKVDFCGITETGHAKGQSYKLAQHEAYTAFWSTTINRHAGVGLVLHRKWCPYIQYTYLNNNRFMYIDLYFKGHIKVRIIVVYLQADITARQQRQALQSQLVALLQTSQAEHYHTLIMGDFNANLDHFYQSVSKNNKGSWRYTIYHYLQ